MSRRGIVMTLAQVEAYNARHGFGTTARSSVEPPKYSQIIPRDKRNKTETEFGLILEAMKQRGEIASYRFADCTLQIDEGCRYTPDYRVDRGPDHLPLFVEVKGGFIREDGMIKFRAARALHTWADFEMWQRKQGQWSRLL